MRKNLNDNINEINYNIQKNKIEGKYNLNKAENEMNSDIDLNNYNNNSNSISDSLSLLKSKLDEMNITLSNSIGNNNRILM